jgi:hypothetical protein
MKKILLTVLTFLLASCSSEKQIIGEWQNIRVSEDITYTQNCTFSQNYIETCKSKILVPGIPDMTVNYATTQEWSIKSGVITEKLLDKKVGIIYVGSESIEVSDSRYQNIANLILSSPIGETYTRKIDINGDEFDLHEKDSISKWKKIK